MREFVLGLGLPTEAEQRLLELTPSGYTGLASELVDLLRTGPPRADRE
jgi:adenylosuccinate lyase